ncbi:MAG: exodeoxyribonuclease VII large subunit [Lactobacillus sp.]
MVAKEDYLTVSDLNYYIGQKFKRDPYLKQVYLKGELSNYRFRQNAHQYFSLKDDRAKIDCVMWRNNFAQLKFRPQEGMQVYVTGYVATYAPQGSYQFYVESMEPAGLGALYEQLQELKKKLAAEGLFVQERKRPLPHFPDKIAVVTSPSGAVIHDIMVTCNRRFPHAEVDLFPAQVQGDTAKDSIVAAMQQAAQGDYDVLIVGRGGGSLEDLWPFNEENVVRQVVAMPMPVISSVGHETDTTLCDLAADQRAATPTAAAEYATPNLPDELINIRQLGARLAAEMQANIVQRRDYLARLQNSVVMRHPERMYDQQDQTLDLLKTRLAQAAENRLSQPSTEVKLFSQRLTSALQQTVTKKNNDYRQLVQQLDALSPLKVLGRGYVYTSDENGKTIAKASEVAVGASLQLHFADGVVQAKALAKEKNDGSQEK